MCRFTLGLLLVLSLMCPNVDAIPVNIKATAADNSNHMVPQPFSTAVPSFTEDPKLQNVNKTDKPIMQFSNVTTRSTYRSNITTRVPNFTGNNGNESVTPGIVIQSGDNITRTWSNETRTTQRPEEATTDEVQGTTVGLTETPKESTEAVTVTDAQKSTVTAAAPKDTTRKPSKDPTPKDGKTIGDKKIAKGGLSGGLIFLICVLVCILVAIGIIIFVRIRRSASKDRSTQESKASFSKAFQQRNMSISPATGLLEDNNSFKPESQQEKEGENENATIENEAKTTNSEEGRKGEKKDDVTDNTQKATKEEDDDDEVFIKEEEKKSEIKEEEKITEVKEDQNKKVAAKEEEKKPEVLETNIDEVLDLDKDQIRKADETEKHKGISFADDGISLPDLDL